MRLTLAGEYAIRTLLYLAELPNDRRALITEVSAACGIPENFLRNITLKLSKSQLVMTHRGAGGGIKIMPNPEKITLLDIIEAVEGKLALNHCLVSSQEFCGRSEWCSVHLVWSEAQQKMVEILKATSLADLVVKNRIRYDEMIKEKLSGKAQTTEKVLVTV